MGQISEWTKNNGEIGVQRVEPKVYWCPSGSLNEFNKNGGIYHGFFVVV